MFAFTAGPREAYANLCSQRWSSLGIPTTGRLRSTTARFEASQRPQAKNPREQSFWLIRSMAAETALSRTTITQFWSARDLQPHRIEIPKLSAEPPLD